MYMYECICMDVNMAVCIDSLRYGCICVEVWMHAWMYGCMDVCMDVNISVYVCIDARMY